MKNLIANFTLASALLAAGAAQAVPLFNLGGSTLFNPPALGASVGTVLVDDGSFAGFSAATLGGASASYANRMALIDGGPGLGVAPGAGILLGSYVFPTSASSYSVWQYGFAGATGVTYDFSYNFLTNQFGAGATNDFFVAGLFRATGSSTTVLASASALGSPLVAGPAGSLAFMTGPTNISFTVPAAGSYTVEFIVGSALGNAGVPSFAVVSVVPEPSTYLLLALGGALLAARVRRRG